MLTIINSRLYPAGFLKETEATIMLLFPRHNFRECKQVQRASRREFVDIKAAIKEICDF